MSIAGNSRSDTMEQASRHPYRMLALDMDGTLLTSDKRISTRTERALRMAASRGVAVVLSTGRAASEVEDYREQLDGVVRYLSLLNGGVVRDFETNETLFAQSLPAELMLEVVAQGLAEDAMVQMFTTEYAVMTQRDVDRMPQIGQGVFQDLAQRRGHLTPSIFDYARRHQDEICKINLHHVDGASLARTRHALEGLPLQLVEGVSATVEVTPRGVTKALGLGWLCRNLDIDPRAVIAVGDSDNDLEALEMVGLPVAMGNATATIRGVARVVVADNDHDGIVDVVDHWL